MQTAREVNRLAMLHYEYHYDENGEPHKRTLPTPEQAEDYVQCVRMLQHYYENIEPLSDEQLKELETKREMYDALHLDMRNTVFEENGKKGLKSATGKLLVPALYDAFPELYDDTIYRGWGYNWCCPVVVGRKYGLVQYACAKNRNQSTLITPCKYDIIFRYFGLWQSYFVCQMNGKYGLLEPHKGGEVIPCLQDEIYAAEDFDGIVAFKRDGKYGLYSPGHCTDAIFEDVKLQSEDYVVATIGKTFGYIDKSGNLTHFRQEAFFGSWNDLDK